MDDDTSHIVLCCEDDAINTCHLRGLYTHGAGGGSSAPTHSVRLIGNPAAGDSSAFTISGLLVDATIMSADTGAIYVGRCAVSGFSCDYSGQNDVICSQYARVTDAHWRLSTSALPTIRVGAQLRGWVRGGSIDYWTNTGASAQGLIHERSVGRIRQYGQGNRIEREIDQSGHECSPGLQLGPDLGDADVTVRISDGTSRALRSATPLTAARTITVSPVYAVAGQRWEVLALHVPSPHTLAIVNGGSGGGTLRTLSAPARVVLVFDGTDWAEENHQPFVAYNIGAEVLVGGDCEDATDWTAYNAATLTDSAASPHSGTNALRVAYNGTNNPAARQDVITAGKRCRIRGYARGDGASAYPRVFENAAGVLWTGTTSASWQAFDLEFTAAGSFILMQAMATAAGWAEFDDLSIVEVST